MHRSTLRCCTIVFANLIWSIVGSEAGARSEYNREFWALYQSHLGKFKETTRCNACHYGNDKQNRNDFGKEFGRTLGQNSSKDGEKIKAALRAAEQQKSATPEQTFGDLIRAGKLPGKRP